MHRECTDAARSCRRVGSVTETMVGAARIELATTCSQSRYATAALRPEGSNYLIRRRSLKDRNTTKLREVHRAKRLALREPERSEGIRRAVEPGVASREPVRRRRRSLSK